MDKIRKQQIQKRIKKECIAESYMEDANNYIGRIDKLVETEFANRANQCKLYVDLLLAIECIIKAVIAYDAVDNNAIDAKGLYNKIKKGGHSISNLSKLLSKDSKVIFDKHIKDKKILDNNDYMIDLRYSIETKIRYRLWELKSNATEPEYYSKIGNWSLFNSLLNQVKEYKKEIDIKYKEPISPQEYGDTTLEDEPEYYLKYLKQLEKPIKKCKKEFKLFNFRFKIFIEKYSE